MRAVLVAVLAVIAGCATSGGGKPISEYPEARRYLYCASYHAVAYAQQLGSPIDLAIVALSACRSEEYAMEQALRQDNSAQFVNAFMKLNRQSMIESTARDIVETRNGNPPRTAKLYKRMR